MANDGLKQRRSERLEIRTTREDRLLIDRAVSVAGTGLTDFVVMSLTATARRVLADRTEFALNAAARRQWEAINDTSPRDLAGLRALAARPNPFRD